MFFMFTCVSCSIAKALVVSSEVWSIILFGRRTVALSCFVKIVSMSSIGTSSGLQAAVEASLAAWTSCISLLRFAWDVRRGGLTFMVA